MTDDGSIWARLEDDALLPPVLALVGCLYELDERDAARALAPLGSLRRGERGEARARLAVSGGTLTITRRTSAADPYAGGPIDEIEARLPDGSRVLAENLAWVGPRVSVYASSALVLERREALARCLLALGTSGAS